MRKFSGLHKIEVCQEIKIQLVPKGNRFTKIDRIEQGLFRKGQIETGPGGIPGTLVQSVYVRRIGIKP